MVSGCQIDEYEARSSPEALAVKDIDRLEMVVQVVVLPAAASRFVAAAPHWLFRSSFYCSPLQADEYERATGVDLGDFFATTAGKFVTAPARAVVAELVARRRRRLEEASQQQQQQQQQPGVGGVSGEEEGEAPAAWEASQGAPHAPRATNAVDGEKATATAKLPKSE